MKREYQAPELTVVQFETRDGIMNGDVYLSDTVDNPFAAEVLGEDLYAE